jgi:sulfite reductase (NADPH) flavoprotein alpha-component
MHIPEIDTSGSPLTQNQLAKFNDLVRSLTTVQSTWLLGFFAGCNRMQTEGTLARGLSVAEAPATVGPAKDPLLILYGSQTGNATRIAKRAQKAAADLGIVAEVKNMADFRTAALKQARHMLVVVSTHGEGEPPDEAKELHRFLHSNRAPRCQDLNFAVLALGDSSYENFCKTGRDFDERLAALGATRIADRVDCDVDFEAKSEAWIADACRAVLARTAGAPAEPAGPSNAHSAAASEAPIAPRKFHRGNPFSAPVLERVRLNARASAKETLHLELGLDGSDLSYQPGDALGIMPHNNPAYAREMLATLCIAETAVVTVAGVEGTVLDALIRQLDITAVSRAFLGAYAERTGHKELLSLLGTDKKAELRAYADGRQTIDVLVDYPAPGLSAPDLVAMLRPLKPRLYSIASSLLAHPGEVHLTIGVTRYQSHGRNREGVCSTFLADRLSADESLPIYVQENPSFRLPASPEAPIIMIGPGTGVAPFRGFVEERAATGAKGRNWLFFGDRNLTADFLYQTEWQRYWKETVLSRMDVAFSRDQDQKIYVQHRMHENKKDFYAWLEEGAHLYVCGDAKKMARHVHDALLQVVQEGGGKSPEAATEYVDQLRRDRRYHRDVY